MNLTRMGYLIGGAYSEFPNFNLNSINTHHLLSKAWLLRELSKLKKGGKIDIEDKSAAILASGCAIWADDLIQLFPTIGKVRSFDIDPAHEQIANRLNASWWKVDRKFAACTADINSLDFSGPTTFSIKDVDYKDYEEQTIDFGVIINTSSEHMASDWASNIPSNKLIIVQSNDYIKSPIKKSQDLADMFGITNVKYKGGINMLGDFIRYMVIGYR